MTVVAKFEQLLLYLLIFSIPFQAGKHFWPPFSYVLGIRVDYLSPTLYFSDIIIAFIFCLFFFRTVSIFLKKKTRGIHVSNNSFLVILFFLLFAPGAISAISPPVALFGMVKVLEFLFLGMYVSTSTFFNKKQIALILISGIIFSSLLALGQFLQQSSVGGPFYFIGERDFTGETPGIANVSLSGHLLLRPYASFPHPNVLAGYLLVSFLLVCFFVHDMRNKTKHMFVGIGFFFSTLGILISMSRTVWFLWVVMLAIFFLTNKALRKYFLALFGAFCISGALFSQSPFMQRITESRFFDESIVMRVDLADAALKMTASSPLLGVGFRNFLVLLPDYIRLHSLATLQPVHNVFLLLIAESGVIVALLVVYFLFQTMRRLFVASQYILLFLVLCIVFIGFFDHYFITLQQGLLLLAVSFGLAWSPYSPSATMKRL